MGGPAACLANLILESNTWMRRAWAAAVCSAFCRGGGTRGWASVIAGRDGGGSAAPFRGLRCAVAIPAACAVGYVSTARAMELNHGLPCRLTLSTCPAGLRFCLANSGIRPGLAFCKIGLLQLVPEVATKVGPCMPGPYSDCVSRSFRGPAARGPIRTGRRGRGARPENGEGPARRSAISRAA